MSIIDRLKRLFGRTPPSQPSEDGTAGWDAINAAVHPLYPDQEPMHWGTLIKYMLGGPDPLDGVSAYRADGPPSHWHYLTYGMTELYRKEWDDPALSGWGFELTFRLARDANDAEAPVWPVNLLQNLARYVFNTAATFAHGHYIDCNGPIALEHETDLVALLFVRDPQLPAIDTPHGRVEFLQAVGITDDEHAACRAWNAEAFCAVLQRGNPLLVTDLARRSILSDPEIAADLEEGQRRDGSSSAAVNVETLAWRRERGRYVIEMTATGFGALPVYLRGRLGHGREFAVHGREAVLAFSPADTDSVSHHEQVLKIALTPATTTRIEALAGEKSGRFTFDEINLEFDVSPTQIRNAAGEIVEEIG